MKTPAPEILYPLELPRINPWRELAIISLITMELCWITPWYLLLTSWAKPVTPLRVFLVFGGIILGADLLVRLLSYLRLRIYLRWGVFLIYIILTALSGLKLLFYYQDSLSILGTFERLVTIINGIDIWFPPEIGILLVTIGLCQRGALLAGSMGETGMIFRDFWVGVVMFILYGILILYIREAVPGFYFYLFIFAGLLSMAFGRFSIVSFGRGGQRSKFDSQRLVGVLAFGMGLVVISGLVASLVQGKMIFPILQTSFSIILRILLVVFALLMSPAILFMTMIFPYIELPNGLVLTFQWLKDLATQVQLLFKGLLIRFGMIDLRKINEIKPFICWGVILLGLSVALLFLSYQLRSKPKLNMSDEESVTSEEDSLGKIGVNIRKSARNLAAFLRRRLGLEPNLRIRVAVRIRQIYADLVELCDGLGHPRQSSQTPLEFLPITQQLFLNREEDLVVITEAYMRARYGEIPETQQELLIIEEAWERIKRQVNNN